MKQTNNLRSKFNELFNELLSVVQKKSHGRRSSDTRQNDIKRIGHKLQSMQIKCTLVMTN